MPSTPAADGSTPTGPDAGASPTPSGTPGVAPPSPTPGPTVTVTGTVEEGVEAGCLVLTAGGTVYLLLGHHAELRGGERVTVEGTLDPDVVTTCMQGTPLRVRSVRTG